MAGIIGGVTMTAGTLIVSWITGTGVVDMAMISGSMLNSRTNGFVWLLGMAVHLAVSSLIALIFALGFEIARKASWRAWHAVALSPA